MKLGKKIPFIVISVLIVSLLISSAVLISSFRKNYTEALLTGTLGLGHSLNSVVTELLSLGLPLDSFSGMDKKCRQLLENNHHISYAGITDIHGTVLYNGDAALVGRVFSDDVMKKRIAATGPITQSYRRFDGLDYYDVTIPITDAANVRIGQISLGFRTSVINDKITAALFQVIINFSLSFIAIALLITYFISRFVSRPVIKISEHAKRIAGGEYDSVLEVATNDEVGTLAASVNQMSSQVKQKTDELEIANAELRQKLVERKEAEDSLKVSEYKFRTFVERSFDVIFVLDAAGVFQFVSPSWETHFGTPVQKVVGHDFRSFVHPDDVAPLECYLKKVLSTGKGDTSPPFQVVCADGSWHLFLANGTPYLDASGRDMYIGIGHDISEQKRAEDERLSLERQLLHAQKLESLGVLAGGIAHDFNNILTSIIGNADLALMRINPESSAIDNLHSIEKAAARAADLAKQMLAYSGKGKFVIEHHDINGLLEEMLHILQVSISKKAVLRLNLARPLPLVEVDATQIRQIIMNLVINASEAIGDRSGFIAISTSCMEYDKNYLKDVWLDETISEGQYVSVEITDTGCGMSKEVLEKLFDPFFTTKFTGRGLGMAAVLGIVRGHSGAIKVYSKPGKGSTFKILLPASATAAEISSHDSHDDEWKGSGTVLLVDDEATIREMASEMLTELGFEVVTANDGREAVDAYKARPDFSFVILDLTMPHLDGDQCFRELRKLNPEVKVIISSGFSEMEVTQKFVGKGLAGFIQKPYRFSALREGIMKLFP
jgi:PAS domain S-box-containing protein